MTKKILVIEDTLKHTQDAQRFFETKPDVEVYYASNYQEANKIMFNHPGIHEISKGNLDGVISDIYFPLSEHEQWNQPEPIGVRVAIELSQFGTPFVLNTAGTHHGRRYEWINQLASAQHWPLIDSGNDYEIDADSKSWEKAYQRLEQKME